MNQRFIDLFDRYTHGEMDRRSFLEKLTVLAGSSAAALALLPTLENNYAKADLLPEGDPRIRTRTVTLANYQVYLASPAKDGKYPSVLVIHENRGLNPHIKDVTRRLAAEGFLAAGADFLTPAGGTPTDEDKAREMIGALDKPATEAGARAIVAALRADAASNGKTDPLEGLKENVIVGRLIPAGTGGQLRRYRKLAAERDEQLAIERAEDAARLAAQRQPEAAE